MSTVKIKKYYSTKRKRDIVTGAAIALFGILIVFQLYITIVFPLQLRHQRLLVAEMEKDEMHEQIDNIRQAIRSARGGNAAQTGEIKLIEGVMDKFALHVREHGKEMTPEQVSALRNELRRYELIICAWNPLRYPGILFPEETRIKVEQDLSDFYGDMDSGREIDFESATAFNKYFGNYRVDGKFRINQNPLDVTPYANQIENTIMNSH